MSDHNYRIEVSKTARYTISGDLKQPVSNLWIVLHGYSQLAPSFILNFEPVIKPGILIAAPEALSRFYMKGYFGNVGASWMTKVERMDDITDNIRYLDLLYNDLLKRLKGIPDKIIVFGFSQGGAAAARWAFLTDKRVDELIIHSCEFPKDIDENIILQFAKKSRIWFVYSNQDEFVDEEVFEKDFEYLRHHKIPFIPFRFDGKHELKPDVISALNQKITVP